MRHRSARWTVARLVVAAALVFGCAAKGDDRVTHSPYALAYSSGRHLVVTGEVVRVVYTDGEFPDDVQVRELISRDGLRWIRQPLAGAPQTHVAVSVWEDRGGRVIGTASHRGRMLTLVGDGGPRAVYESPRPFAVEAPNGSAGGVVFRSRLDGDRMSLWVRWPDGRIERITGEAEEAFTAAGTSGQLQRVGGQDVVLWSGATTLQASWRRGRGWVSEVLDRRFSGVHDVSSVVHRGALWVAYRGASGQLTVRRWVPVWGWRRMAVLGTTEVHATCLWSDGDHLYTVQMMQEPRRLRVWRSDGRSWRPVEREVPVQGQGYLWPCGITFKGRQILAWLEPDAERFVVKTAAVTE